MDIRGQYALQPEQISRVLAKAKQQGIPELFILSTCNRTEIYGLAHAADQLIHLLCEETIGKAAYFKSQAYIHKQATAAEHLFDVAAGLDSQILGDYEIVGQLKTAMKIARAAGTWGSLLDRLVNLALQASKDIKNQTSLSGGTVSVSFAAVQWIKKYEQDLASKQVMLVGAGKIGRNTCKNLMDYGGAKNLLILNRSQDPAEELANTFGVKAGHFQDLHEHIPTADIIITATSAPKAIIDVHHVNDGRPRLIIDLSVPANVDRAVEALPHIHVVRVDELSRITDETLSLRTSEVPRAKAIIRESLREFLEWNQRRRHAPMLNDLKLTLYQLHQHPRLSHHQENNTLNTSLRINKVIRDTAKKLDIKDAKGCHFISALNQFIH